MIDSPSDMFVIERAAWPASTLPGADKAAMKSLANRQGCAGFLMSFMEFIQRRRPSLGPATVLVPPTASVIAFDTALRLDDRHDTQAVATSVKELERYRLAYKESDNWPLALRLRQARFTGLPALLTGYFEDNRSFDNLDRAEEFARQWLSETRRSEIYFGADWATVKPRLRLSDVTVFGRTNIILLARALQPVSSDATTAHVRFQQWHRQWPVFGGECTVHLHLDDPRAWASNSYFPLKPEANFDVKINPEDAKWLGEKALAGYFRGLQSIGLWWGLLRAWVEGSDTRKDQERESPEWFSRVAGRFTQSMAEYSAGHDHALPDVEKLAVAKARPNREDLRAALSGTQKWLRQFEWQVRVVPYAGSPLFILPFANHYHLAYQIELSTAEPEQLWRVFVDAETGDVLGRPENQLAHASYYDRSVDVPHTQTPLTSAELGELDAVVESFMQMQLGSDGQVYTSLGAIEGASEQDIPSSKKLEAFTIAANAKKLFVHFRDNCGAPEAKIKFPNHGGSAHQGLHINFGLTAAGDPLQTFFNPASSLDPKRISFQSGNANTEGKTINSPSLDPELVIHEFAHGFMWLLNRSPFDQQGASVPFARALVEGYATYFARSLGAPRDPDPPPADGPGQHWARAAYGTGAAEWEHRWALTRPIPSGANTRADRLPAPNLYPDSQTEGLPVYDVGMVWARALWDVRELLQNAPGVADVNLADKLALKAYQGLNGYVSSFELAAEGIIIGVQTHLSLASDDMLLNLIKNVFARRGILAELGVQALARVPSLTGVLNDVLVVGTDGGVKNSIDNGTSWNDWDPSELGSKKGVVALAVDDLAVGSRKVYAATESNIYERHLQNGGWSDWSPVSFTNPTPPKLSAWPTTETPLSLLVADGTPYVGAGDNVWEFNNGWAKWGNLTRPARQLADVEAASEPSPLRSRYAALIEGIRLRIDGDVREKWQTADADTINGALVTAIAARGNVLYAGTLNRGIWLQTGGVDSSGVMTFGVWQSLVGIQSSEGVPVPVLFLAVNGNLLYVGTTAGLYQVDLAAETVTATKVTMDPPDPIVTCVLPVDNNMLLVGTAEQGLFVGRPDTQHQGQWLWTQFPKIGA